MLLTGTVKRFRCIVNCSEAIIIHKVNLYTKRYDVAHQSG